MRILNILVVDDDEEMREMLADMLPILLCPQRVVYMIMTKNGREALKMIDQHAFRPDMVITDKDMPHINGVELTAQLKTRFPELPVILMSGNPEPEGHEADSFVSKPFNMENMAKVVCRLTSRATFAA